MYSNNIVNFQESTTILNACIKKVWKPDECPTYLTLIILFNINRLFADSEIVTSVPI